MSRAGGGATPQPTKPRQIRLGGSRRQHETGADGRAIAFSCPADVFVVPAAPLRRPRVPSVDPPPMMLPRSVTLEAADQLLAPPPPVEQHVSIYSTSAPVESVMNRQFQPSFAPLLEDIPPFDNDDADFDLSKDNAPVDDGIMFTVDGVDDNGSIGTTDNDSTTSSISTSSAAENIQGRRRIRRRRRSSNDPSDPLAMSKSPTIFSLLKTDAFSAPNNDSYVPSSRVTSSSSSSSSASSSALPISGAFSDLKLNDDDPVNHDDGNDLQFSFSLDTRGDDGVLAGTTDSDLFY